MYGMVTNSRSVGGFRNIIGKHVVFDDGEFEVTLIKSPKNALELQEIIAALLIEQIDTKHMYTFKTNHITFESLEEIPWTLDGEFGGQHDFVQIHNEKQALQIMVSPEHISSLMEYPEKLSLEAAEEKTEGRKGKVTMEKREKFSSRLGFILISAGCAIGLGNVWRFPYITGQYGGGVFVLIYLFFLLVLGLPIVIMEFAVGRASQKSVALSYEVLEPKGSKWHIHKYFAIAGNFLLMMFYTTVGGWMLAYFFKMLKGEFVGADSEKITNIFGTLTSNRNEMIFWMIIISLLGLAVCSLGLEKASKNHKSNDGKFVFHYACAGGESIDIAKCNGRIGVLSET